MALLKGYLYVVADENRQFVKVEMARDVYVKFHTTRQDCPLKLELVRYEPCTYAKFREAQMHIALRDLHVQGAWFRWDEVRVKSAMDAALAIPDGEVKTVLNQLPHRESLHYPVKRNDTGEIYENSKVAALAVLGHAGLGGRIRKAIKLGGKCGPTTWSRA